MKQWKNIGLLIVNFIQLLTSESDAIRPYGLAFSGLYHIT